MATDVLLRSKYGTADIQNLRPVCGTSSARRSCAGCGRCRSRSSMLITRSRRSICMRRSTAASQPASQRISAWNVIQLYVICSRRSSIKGVGPPKPNVHNGLLKHTTQPFDHMLLSVGRCKGRRETVLSSFSPETKARLR